MAKFINEEVLLNNAVVDKYVVIDKQMFEWLPAAPVASLDRIKSLRKAAIDYRDDEENDFVDFEVGAINGVIALIDELIAEIDDDDEEDDEEEDEE